MSKLPKIQHTIYETTLPSDGSKLKYRSFTGREEKTLLIAKETKEIDQIILGIKQVINNCIIDRDIDTLATFDIEYMLLQLRARSVDNKVEFVIKDPDTEQDVKLELDIDEVKLVKEEDHTNMIRVDADTFLKMRYPAWAEFTSFLTASTDSEVFDIMTACIESVYHKDEIISFDDVDETDREEFFNDMSTETIQGLKNFFDTMPRLRHEMKYTNSEGVEKTFVMEGMNTFFL